MWILLTKTVDSLKESTLIDDSEKKSVDSLKRIYTFNNSVTSQVCFNDQESVVLISLQSKYIFTFV